MAQMMETKAGDAGAFARFDLSRVPSPCFVVDETAIEHNLRILADIKSQSGAHIYLALKAFSMFELAPVVARYLDGVCASGAYEARLGREEFFARGTGTVASFCAAYKDSDFDEVVKYSDHIIFNSPSQLSRLSPRALGGDHPISIGLRINPEHSEGEVEKYDPCAPCSRLGLPISQLSAEMIAEIDGLHFHTLCEQGFEPLARTFAATEDKIGHLLPKLKWINFGGGHHITRDDYDRAALIGFINDVRQNYGVDVILEPGEAAALDAGVLVGEVLDLAHNQMPIAITDISAVCHMPDVIEAPYRPAMLGEPDNAPHVYRLGGPSCLAGDVIGDYGFGAPPKIGQRFAFLDQAHYTMVKTNSFNGVPLPAIALWNSESDTLRIVREFGYDDFKTRLS